MICRYIENLVMYGIQTGLIEESDRIYARNMLMDKFKLDEFDGSDADSPLPALDEILGYLCDYAYEHGLICTNSTVYRDLFDTSLMGVLTPVPSQVQNRFEDEYAQSPERATDYLYKLSCDSNYIRTDRIKKDIRWQCATDYGTLDITINLSKPEKDPAEIAAARNAKQSGYPKCLLCVENVGYAGRINSPARQNHRVADISICGSGWALQYSPYVYYNEHCILLNKTHTPMVIDRSAFDKLLDFVSRFPHYFIGSNADLPIVGGSILSHEHFQGGRYEFAMARAEVERPLDFSGYEGIEAGIVKWPMSVIRLRGKDKVRVASLADRILRAWRVYSDASCGIFAQTDGVMHNTVTPIARYRDNAYELDLVLRNNLTTDEHPMGVFHPHAELHHIKKENIGLIEVMGLAVLPSRLADELDKIGAYLIGGENTPVSDDLEKHIPWIRMIKDKYSDINEENAAEILRQETGKVFLNVLEHAGVYKRTAQGQAGFMRFAGFVNTQKGLL